MTRLKQAWLALTGRLEPEVREVPVFGSVEVVTLYRVRVYGYFSCIEFGPQEYTKATLYYLTCVQAHSENASASVTTEAAFVVSGRYFLQNGMREVTPQPKPKVAKGRGE